MSKRRDSVLPPQVRDSLIAANRLSSFLRRGGSPEPILASIPLFESEQVYSAQTFSLYEFAGRNVTYNRTLFGIGSPMMFAATLAGSALFNYSRKQRAIAEAAAQWRVVSQGTAFVTNLRFGLQGLSGWFDVPFDAIRNSDLAPYEGILFFLDGANPMKLVLPWPEYHFLLFQFLAYRRVIPFELPVDLLESDMAVAPQQTELNPHA